MFSCLIIADAEPSCSQNLHFDHSALGDTANSQEDRFNRWLFNKCASEFELASLASLVKTMIRAFAAREWAELRHRSFIAPSCAKKDDCLLADTPTYKATSRSWRFSHSSQSYRGFFSWREDLQHGQKEPGISGVPLTLLRFPSTWIYLEHHDGVCDVMHVLVYGYLYQRSNVWK